MKRFAVFVCDSHYPSVYMDYVGNFDLPKELSSLMCRLSKNNGDFITIVDCVKQRALEEIQDLLNDDYEFDVDKVKKSIMTRLEI